MHRQTKATSIPASVKARVSLRDCSGGHPDTCIICGAPGAPVCHCVRRSQGGMGIEQNIVCMCNECHFSHDEGLFMSRLRPLGFETQQDVQEYVKDYLRGHYPGWTPESVKYHKYKDDSDD